MVDLYPALWLFSFPRCRQGVWLSGLGLYVGSPQNVWHMGPYVAIYYGSVRHPNSQQPNQWSPIKCLPHLKRYLPGRPSLPIDLCTYPRTFITTPNPDIKGVTPINWRHSPTTFSYFSRNHTLPYLTYSDFATFKIMTNLQINFAKSEAPDTSLEKDTITQCQTNFPFKWSQDSITYLGIHLLSKLSNLYTKNYISILQNIQKDFKSWPTGLFSWFGKASIVKMNTILPRILYYMSSRSAHKTTTSLFCLCL